MVRGQHDQGLVPNSQAVQFGEQPADLLVHEGDLGQVGIGQPFRETRGSLVRIMRIVEVDEEPSLADALVGGLEFDNRYTFNLIKDYVDETVLISEHEIAAAMTFALQKHQLVVEGGGAAGIAALLYGKVQHLGENIVVVVSGGNVDLSMLSQVALGKYEYQQE